jgi:hypothetical protein
MSGFAITQRAFRFNVGSREFAIDIQSNILFETEPGGIGVSLYERDGAVWLNKFIEFGQPLMGAGDAAINAAGGVVPFCRLIVARVNAALNVIFGGGDLEPPENLAEAVQDYLLANLQVVYVEGKPQVRLP